MSEPISPADSQDVAAAKFLGFVPAANGHPGPHQFTHFLWHADLGIAVVGRGRTRKAAREDAASRAVARHMQSAFIMQQAIDKAFANAPAQPPGAET